MQEIQGDAWSFADHFDAPNFVRLPDRDITILEAREYLAAAKISEHPFFKIAKGSRSALKLWACQECVITNFFSQTLFALMSMVKNVHLRSLLMPVVAGEHSLLCEGKATSSHPHLLGKLVVEMGCDPTTILPIAPTIQFSKSLTSSLESIPRALGCLGIGNEAMLIPEYSAIESLFSDIYEKSVYQPFLRANIEEDRGHSALMEIAAVASFGSGEGRIEFLTGAKAGVDARVSYYSELTKIVGAMGSELQ